MHHLLGSFHQIKYSLHTTENQRHGPVQLVFKAMALMLSLILGERSAAWRLFPTLLRALEKSD